MIRTKRVCTICGLPIPTGNKCGKHTINKGYSTAHWQRVSKMKLHLDDYVCMLNHPGCTKTATTVHLDPALNANHRLATLSNTTSACLHCHGTEDQPRAHGYPPASQTD